ncbi:MAG: hypothetical protein JSU96_00035 [Acidobacteriota bacterium]|nr:MAG: hypothetical protein JSU96_00035 [Acidobacteriota bacterium]
MIVMNGDGTKWLTGCGIGCAVLIVILALVGYGGYLLVQNVIDEAEDIGRTISEVTDEYGEIRDYTPRADGRITPKMVEDFLSVRSTTEPTRSEISGRIVELESQIGTFEEGKKPGVWEVINLIRDGAGTIPLLAKFHGERAQALLEQGQPLGEYVYVYVLSYHCFLKKPIGDGPQFLTIGRDNNTSWDPERNPEDVSDERAIYFGRATRAQFRSFYQNLLDRSGEPDSDSNPEWITAVREEMEKLDSQPGRVPWQDGLPQVITESLEPYRSRLEAAYDGILNPIELMSLDH